MRRLLKRSSTNFDTKLNRNIDSRVDVPGYSYKSKNSFFSDNSEFWELNSFISFCKIKISFIKEKSFFIVYQIVSFHLFLIWFFQINFIGFVNYQTGCVAVMGIATSCIYLEAWNTSPQAQFKLCLEDHIFGICFALLSSSIPLCFFIHGKHLTIFLNWNYYY